MNLLTPPPWRWKSMFYPECGHRNFVRKLSNALQDCVVTSQHMICSTWTFTTDLAVTLAFSRWLSMTVGLLRPSVVNAIKVKVNCALVQTLRLCTGRTAHRGNRGIALHFHDHGTRRVWGVRITPRPLFTPEKDPVPLVQENGWAPGPVWTGAENLASNVIRSSDRPDRSQSLYRLSYRAHSQCGFCDKESGTGAH